MFKNNKEINVTIDSKMISKDIPLINHLDNIDKLNNIMDSLCKLSTVFAPFYNIVCRGLSEFTLTNNSKNSNLRKEVVIAYNSYFKRLSSTDSDYCDTESLLDYDETEILLENPERCCVIVTTASDLLSAYNKFNYDFGSMIKDSDISKWKERYFKDIEKDLIKIFSEIDTYRLSMEFIFLTASAEISNLNIKINKVSDIVDAINLSFSEINTLHKECSNIHYQICQNAIDLSKPIPVSDVMVNNEQPTMEFGNTIINPDLPEDF